LWQFAAAPPAHNARFYQRSTSETPTPTALGAALHAGIYDRSTSELAPPPPLLDALAEDCDDVRAHV